MRKGFVSAIFACMKGYFTANQAAEKLGVSAGRIRQMILDGVIKEAEKFGRDNAITEDEVLRLQSVERKPGRPAKPKG